MCTYYLVDGMLAIIAFTLAPAHRLADTWAQTACELQECVSRLQQEQCHAYSSGEDAAYMIKMMIMKVAHKDWTAIHRQLIVSKAKALRALLPAVVHLGCEATLSPAGAPLGPALPLNISGAPHPHRFKPTYLCTRRLFLL